MDAASSNPTWRQLSFFRKTYFIFNRRWNDTMLKQAASPVNKRSTWRQASIYSCITCTS